MDKIVRGGAVAHGLLQYGLITRISLDDFNAFVRRPGAGKKFGGTAC
jgi:hypothetical protein